MKTANVSKKIPEGRCQCGCGSLTTIAPRNDRTVGYVKGTPRRFLPGHFSKTLDIRGEKSPSWKGGRHVRENGYTLISQPTHPRAHKGGDVLEHILIAEKALGKILPPGAQVHHVDKNKGNNQNSNLVICQDQVYHLLLHTRSRALKACGHALWRKCWICKQWDDPNNLHFIEGTRPNSATPTRDIAHIQCRRDYRRLARKGRALAQQVAA